MTILEFREKRKNIEKTHPAPAGLSEGQVLRYHSKIAQNWINQMIDIEDVKIAQIEERELISLHLQD